MSDTTPRTRWQARQEGSPPEFQELQPQQATIRKSKKKQKPQQPVTKASQPDDPQQTSPQDLTEAGEAPLEKEGESATEPRSEVLAQPGGPSTTAEETEDADRPQRGSAEADAPQNTGQQAVSQHPFEMAVHGSITAINPLDAGNSLSTKSEAALAEMQTAMKGYDDPEGLTIGNRHFSCVGDYVRFMASLPVETFETFLRADKMAVGRAETYLSIRKVQNSFVMEHTQKIGRWSESGEMTHSEWLLIRCESRSGPAAIVRTRAHVAWHWGKPITNMISLYLNGGA
ncbi:hypothetical protein KEM55_003690, partial [Ascosphaera atra]